MWRGYLKTLYNWQVPTSIRLLFPFNIRIPVCQCARFFLLVSRATPNIIILLPDVFPFLFYYNYFLNCLLYPLHIYTLVNNHHIYLFTLSLHFGVILSHQTSFYFSKRNRFVLLCVRALGIHFLHLSHTHTHRHRHTHDFIAQKISTW